MTDIQKRKLRGLDKTHPGLRVLFLDEGERVVFTLAPRFRRGQLMMSRAGRIEPGGKIEWIS